ncbi:MAG: metallophosphoesterase [Polyangiaceae bacterium]|nr:metallophosphoesterase [Polyangiaceae bacterium]
MDRAAAALARARARPGPGELGRYRREGSRAYAVGDLQASAERIFDIFAHHGLLADDGALAPDVQLLAIGDYFDFGTRASGHVATARRDGYDVLTYLAAHAPEQVVLLAGNHDLARVMELAEATFDRFEGAALLAAELVALRDREPAAYRARLAEFSAAYPELPGPGLVHRDYSAFSEEQRALVQRLLVSGRMRLAATARLPSGERVLATHAGVTLREVAMLDLDEVAAAPLAAALERRLAQAVADAAGPWQRGEPHALSLAPLHVPGATGRLGPEDLPEGGGMLYHRPADPDRPGVDRPWEAAPGRPRRFHPCSLPTGVVQLAGHTGHPKCVEELARWSEPGMAEVPCGRRSLRVRGQDVRYQLGAARPEDGEAVLYLIDPSMHRAPSAASVELFELMPGSLG